MKKVWPIENLDCAACAAKLEEALGRVNGVESVRVNFLASTLTLVAADDVFEKVTAAVIEKTAKVEPEAVICLDGVAKGSHAKAHAHSGKCGCGGHHHDHDEHCDCGHHHEHDEHCDCGHHHEHDEHCDCGHHHEHDEHCECGHHHEHNEHCGCGDHHEHTESSHAHASADKHGAKKQAKEPPILLIRVACAVLLLVIGLLLPASLQWLQIVLFLLAYLTASYDVLWKAIKNIRHGQIFDENFLMTIASIGALCMREYPEAIAVMSLYQIGEWFQDRAVDKSRESIAAMMDIRPDYANLLENGDIRTIHPEEAEVGDTIVIRPGEKVPLDGVVLEGTSSLNTVALTGESLPRDVAVGDSVISGCVNLSGVLTVRVTSVFGESTVSKILNLVETSGDNKAKTEKFISKFARYYTPAVCAAALLLAIVPSLVTGQWSKWVTQALSFLVISCPCALVISVPLTFFSGIGGASRKGILIKGANYMEVLAGLDTVAFDKTGTLTEGVFNVTAIHPEMLTKEELLEITALAECYSTHPISQSLQKAYNQPLNQERVTDVEEIAGHGVKALVDGKQVYAGNEKLMTMIGIKAKPCHHQGTIVHIACDGQYYGHIVISDEIKPSAKKAMAELKQEGVTRLVMLTGDRRAVAEDIAAKIGLTEVKSELLPADKVTALEGLLGDSHKVAFVGDGINDAPVLRRADLGIAMGAMGSDAAIEAADVVLMDDDPIKLPAAMRIARRTMGIVRQNIAFALGVKALIMLLGFLGIANMWLAVFADVGVAMLAILNAMRAMK